MQTLPQRNVRIVIRQIYLKKGLQGRDPGPSPDFQGLSPPNGLSPVHPPRGAIWTSSTWTLTASTGIPTMSLIARDTRD